MKTFTITARLSVDEAADEHLQTNDAIADEVRSWLSDLGADVDEVTVSSEEEHHD